VRVLYFSDSYTPHDVRFLSFLGDCGYDVLFLQRRVRQVVDSRPLPDNVTRLAPLDAGAGSRRRLGIALVDELRQLLAEIAPDIVHAGPVQACAWLVSRIGFPRLVTMSWGSDLMRDAGFGLGRWQAAMTLRRTSAFIGDCVAVRRRAVELGMDESRTVVLPWGVDLDRFRPGAATQLRDRLGWQGAVVLLCLRAWEPGYGVDTVLQAFLRAARHEPSLRLILGGDGSLRPQLVARVEGSGMADRVWLPGYLPYDELPLLYQSADIYLSGSHSDGSSVSLLEAMASGLPAFVSDIAGNREWIEDDVAGRLFPPGDVPALEDLLREAPRLADDLRGYGRQARAMVEARADWRRNAPRMLTAYALALSGERGPA
jgi:glycosyltransferase involved in cell wall biosynthesis